MAKDYFVSRNELYTSIREVLPFDDEHGKRFELLDHGYRFVEGYGPGNPIATAFSNEEKKRTVVVFGICPHVRSGETVSFASDDHEDAYWKMSKLMEHIMLSARYRLEFRPLTEMMEEEWAAIQQWERSKEERERQQVG